MQSKVINKNGLSFTMVEDKKGQCFLLMREVLTYCGDMKRHDFLELIDDRWPERPVKVAVNGKLEEIIKLDIVLLRASIGRKDNFRALTSWILNTFHLVPE